MDINKFFENYKIEFGEGVPTIFDPELHINQDGTTPMYRDTDGKLWAMSGHTHAGRIATFCGTSLDDIKELYPIKTNLKREMPNMPFRVLNIPRELCRGAVFGPLVYIFAQTHTASSVGFTMKQVGAEREAPTMPTAPAIPLSSIPIFVISALCIPTTKV